MKIYDVAFVGLGASALSTIKLLFENTDYQLIGIDKKFNNNRNNFFGFWLTDWMSKYEDLIDERWVKWNFNLQEIEVAQESIATPYCVIRYQKWKEYCLKNLNNLEIKELNVTSILKNENYFEITLNNKEVIFAKKIYDSRVPDLKKDKLKQHFIGHIIQPTNGSLSVPMRLMDFRVNQDQGLHFMYVLPLQNNRILVESTVFSKSVLQDHWYEEQIETYVKKILNIHDFKILEKEKGILPMHEIQTKKNTSDYINIGTRGGASKTSSGYAFSFYLKQLTKCLNEQTASFNGYHSLVSRWMDNIFVDFIEHSKNSELVFINLAKNLTGLEFSSFMMGVANFKTKIKIILAMPKIPFIRSMFRVIGINGRT